jgi:uncharacterized protein
MTVQAFHSAVKAGDRTAVERALRTNPELVLRPDNDSQSAYLLARYHGKDEVAAFLLGFLPELDLFEATAAGDLPTVQRELNLRPEQLERHNVDGWTPLHLAAFFGEERVAQALLDRGAAPNARSTNRMRNTPLHAAAAGGRTGIVKLLLENGADANSTQEGGWTALHAAAQLGNVAMLQLLLAQGASPNTRAANDQTPLDLALLQGRREIAAILDRVTATAGHA